MDGNRINLIVLDVMLPEEDGISICKHLRTHSQMPQTRMAKTCLNFSSGISTPAFMFRRRLARHHQAIRLCAISSPASRFQSTHSKPTPPLRPKSRKAPIASTK
jgi:CheY-like chemotaxis protein